MKILDYKQNLNTYTTEHWQYEKVHRLVLSLDDKTIECSVFEHFGENKQKVSINIEISSMYGCPMKCKYCASNLIKRREDLSSNDMLSQVETAIKHTKVDISDYPIFIVSFSGIGEPSLIPDKIIKAAYLILEKYPNVKFYISSVCADLNFIDTVNKSGLPFASFWVTYVHYDAGKAGAIIPTLSKFNYDFKNIVKKLKSFDVCKVKINYIFIKDFNDSNEDIEQLLKRLEPVRDKVIVRITRINPTAASCQNHLGAVSSERLLEIADIIKLKGFQKHIYFTDINDNFNCGQLIYNYNKK